MEREIDNFEEERPESGSKPSSRVLPSNIQAEESLLGAMLLTPIAIGTAAAILSPSDFYKPAHGHIYDAIMKLHDGGMPADPVTVADELRRAGQLDAIGGPATLVNLQAATPATSNAGRYAKIIEEHALLRRLIGVATGAVDSAYDLPDDPGEVVESVIAELREIGADRGGVLPQNLVRMDEFLGRPIEARSPWVIPGLLRTDWRIILTATEGAGKTYLLRQIAASAAAGVHCFDPGTQIPPQRVLLIDLENPGEHIDKSFEMIEHAYTQAEGYHPDNLWLWHEQGGINLRSRADRARFETTLQKVRPDLVCLGPLYKAYHLSARETDEIAVREVQAVLDDLRTRYGFGLVMEHHAAKASGGGKRNLDPYGSSFWMRWPELGIGMEAKLDSEDVLLGRWRGDRLENSWPDSVFRSKPWPWSGRWENGQNFAGSGKPMIMSTSAPKPHKAPRSNEF